MQLLLCLLLPQRLDVVNFLYRFHREDDRVLLADVHTVFDTDTHTAEMLWPARIVGDVYTAKVPQHEVEWGKGIYAYGSIVTT